MHPRNALESNQASSSTNHAVKPRAVSFTTCPLQAKRDAASFVIKCHDGRCDVRESERAGTNKTPRKTRPFPPRSGCRRAAAVRRRNYLAGHRSQLLAGTPGKIAAATPTRPHAAGHCMAGQSTTLSRARRDAAAGHAGRDKGVVGMGMR